MRLTALLLSLVPLAGAARPLAIDEALSIALERNPSILSARSDVAVSRARLGGASLLLQSNPELEAAAGPRSGPDGDAIDWSIGLSQRLEPFGQRGARRDAARALSASTDARLADRRVQVAAEVRARFARAIGARERAAIAQDAYELARQALQAAEARERAGGTSRIEVNAARAALGRAAHDRAEWARRAAAARGELAVFIGLGAEEAVEPAGALAIGPERPPAPVEALVQRALADRPELRSARLEVEAARAEHRLAVRDAWPSPTLGVSYSEEGEPGRGATRILQGVVAFELPLWDRNQEARAVASARETQSRHALAALERAARSEVEIAAERVRVAQQAAQEYAGGLLGALEENTRLVGEAYRAGKLDFFQVLVVRRETLDARMAHVDALEELQAAKAELSRALGSVE